MTKNANKHIIIYIMLEKSFCVEAEVLRRIHFFGYFYCSLFIVPICKKYYPNTRSPPVTRRGSAIFVLSSIVNDGFFPSRQIDRRHRVPGDHRSPAIPLPYCCSLFSAWLARIQIYLIAVIVFAPFLYHPGTDPLKFRLIASM